jgi:transcriptional regulator with XRE-family HTH domain
MGYSSRLQGIAKDLRPSLGLKAGERLKEIRSRLGISTRDVTDLSGRIAESEGNEDFYISNAWLTQIENSDSIPSVYKLFSLSVIYHLKLADLLQLFGVDVQKISKYQIETRLRQTHLTPVEVFERERSVSFPVRFDRGFEVTKTNLLSRMVEVWGKIPIPVLEHFDLRHGMYGFIGIEDLTLYPLLRPGSFVQIDQRIRTILPMKWGSEYDRPIYFVELRDGYACSWCELQEGQLILIPHPLSPCKIRQFRNGTDAEIIGRVTGIATRIAENDHLEDSGNA